MQTKNLAFVVDQARDERQNGPIVDAVRGSIQAGGVVLSTLRKQLKAAGFAVVEDEATHAEYGFTDLSHLERVLVTDKTGAVVAMGASFDHDDALLHAMLGWFRENALPDSQIPAGIR